MDDKDNPDTVAMQGEEQYSHSAVTAYTALASGFYVRLEDSHDPAPKISSHHLDGVIVPVYSRREYAEESARHLGPAYGVAVGVQSVAALWDTIIDFADRGFAGIMLDEKYPVHFLNRLSDMDRSRPSLAKLGLHRLDGNASGLAEFDDVVYFGVRGIARVHKGAIVHWQDFEKLDRTSTRWMLGDRPLPESIEPWTMASVGGQYIVFHDAATLLGPYVSDLGAVPVFSHRMWAEYYGLCKGILEHADDDRVVPTEDIEPHPISGGLPAFLDRVYEDHLLGVDIGLNPTCHRFRQGYFFKAADGGGDYWFLRTISGVFRLDDGCFTPRPDVLPPKGDEVGRERSVYALFQDVASVARQPFARITGRNLARLSDGDADDILADELVRPLAAEFDQAPFGPDAFALDGFDKIDGQTLSGCMLDANWGGPLLFPDIVAACNWLIQGFLPADEQVRVHGARTCHGPGVPGSHDAGAEAEKTADMKEAISRLLRDALTKGYRPQHSLHLQRLFRDASATMELTVAGYLADLAFFDLAEQFSDQEQGQCGGTALDGTDKGANAFLPKFRALKQAVCRAPHVDEAPFRRLKRSMGSAYDELSEDSKLILGTSLQEWQGGQRPNYDYAGITMKLCKVLERELRARVFQAWRVGVLSSVGSGGLGQMRREAHAASRDRNGDAAMRWLEQRGRLELGPMRYCLKQAAAAGNPHPALTSLHRFVGQLADPGWLLSQGFESSLEAASGRYRNGGVHEHVVTFEVCEEALNALLLGPDAVIPRMLLATKSLR